MWPFRWRQVKFSGVASQKSQLVKESGSGNMVQTANNGEKVVHNNDLNNVHCSQLHFESLSLKKPHQNSWKQSQMLGCVLRQGHFEYLVPNFSDALTHWCILPVHYLNYMIRRATQMTNSRSLMQTTRVEARYWRLPPVPVPFPLGCRVGAVAPASSPPSSPHGRRQLEFTKQRKGDVFWNSEGQNKSSRFTSSRPTVFCGDRKLVKPKWVKCGLSDVADSRLFHSVAQTISPEILQKQGIT